MKRVMIIGQPGSGKSTLAQMLGEVTGLPVVHMDRIHWKAGWVQREEAARWQMVREAHAQEHWIFEGGFSRSWGERAARADTLIWLDVGLSLRLWRVTYRFLRDYGKVRPDMASGCPEGNWNEMWIFYKWIWQTRHSARDRIRMLIEEYGPERNVAILKTVKDVSAYVETARARTA